MVCTPLLPPRSFRTVLSLITRSLNLVMRQQGHILPTVHFHYLTLLSEKKGVFVMCSRADK
jgi:hypothetical protein